MDVKCKCSGNGDVFMGEFVKVILDRKVGWCIFIIVEFGELEVLV